MEVTIANLYGTSFSVAKSKNNRAEFKKNVKVCTSSTQEVMIICKAQPVWIIGGANLEEKRSIRF